MLKYVKLFESFDDRTVQLNENAAKDFMLNMVAIKVEKQKSELSPIEIKKAFEDPNYKKIIELTTGYPGYALPFLKFHFNHGATIQDLETLMNQVKTKRHIIQSLPHNFDWYANQDKINDVPGFEALNDQIRKIERNKEAKWIVDRLPINLRNKFRAAPEEKQQVLLNAAHSLTDLGDDITKRLMSKIKAIDSWQFDDVLTYINNYLSGYSNAQMNTKIDEIVAISPEAGIIYNDDRYLVISLRTEAAQIKLCSVAGTWCINRGSFSSYAKEAVQINIFDFGVSPADPLFLTGTTINYNGKITSAANINNNSTIVQGESLQQHFSRLGYPKMLIDDLVQSLPVEYEIKQIVYGLKIDSESPVSILKSIIFSDYTAQFENNSPETLKIASDIINDRVIQNASKDEILSFYLTKGILSPFSARLFMEIFGTASKEYTDPVIAQTKYYFNLVTGLVKKNPKIAETPAIKNSLKNKDAVYSMLGISEQN